MTKSLTAKDGITEGNDMKTTDLLTIAALCGYTAYHLHGKIPADFATKDGVPFADPDADDYLFMHGFLNGWRTAATQD